MHRSSSNKYSRIGSDGVGHSPFQGSWSTFSPGPNDLPSPAEYELQHRPTTAPQPRNEKTTDRLQYTIVESHDGEEGPDDLKAANFGATKVNTGYNPPFTRLPVLLCFAVLWAMIIVSLQIVYTVSEAQKGLANVNGSLRYLWTYGPTAFFVVVTVMWRQVDYAAKYIQPWAELAKGPLPAERTLLLDYITPLQFVALWRALKLKHATVASTISIFALIKVLTIISTGLFTLDIVPFDKVPQTMKAITEFNSTGGLPAEKIDARAATAVYGAKTYNMHLPNGTTDQYAYQLFEPALAAPNDTYAYNASVDVFIADGWECETGSLTYKNGTDHDGAGDGTTYEENTPTMFYYNTTIKLPDCEIHNGHLDAPSWMYEQNETTVHYGYWGTLQAVNCSNLDPTDPKFNRFTVSVAYSVGRSQDNSIMLNSSNVVCLPTYRVQPASVNLFTNGTSDSNVQFSGSSRQLEGVKGADVALAVLKTLGQAGIPRSFDPYDVTTDSFLASMMALTPGFEKEMLMNATWLAAKSKVVYQQHASQIAGLYLLQHSPVGTALLDGTIARNEQRLVVRQLPTRLMQGIAALTLVLTITMTFTMPRGVVPRSVESVAAVAVILARSPHLRKILRSTGHLGIEHLSQVLANHRFMSTVANGSDGRTFSIRVIDGNEPIDTPSPKTNNIKWVRPLVLRRLVMTSTLLLAVVVLVALEVLYQESQEHDGISNVDPESLQRYAWLYVPTIVLVLLATTFNVLDFELEFADPYHELARGYTPATSSLLWDPLRTISVRTALKALQHSRFALVASSVSVIFAPLLTIIVSGLFEVRSVPHTQDTTAKALTWFNSSPTDAYFIASVAQEYALPDLILQGNMSYPKWTWNEMAFPSIDLSSQTTGITNATAGTIVIEAPAIRAHVNCTSVPKSDYGNLTAISPDYKDSVYYNISAIFGCQSSQNADNGSTWYDGTITKPMSGTGYLGAVIQSGFGRNTNSANVTVTCPSYYLAFGKVDGDSIENWNFYSCFTGLETVQTNATISLDQATIVTDPIVQEATSKIFNDYYYPDGTVKAPYFAQRNYTHDDETFDEFTNVMVYGKDGIPPIELLDGNVLVQQFTHTYRQWLAQWVNTYMRNPVGELAKNQSNIAGSLPDLLPGLYNDPNKHRLFLNEVSTRLLQGVIAVLLLCGGVIFLLVDMSKVLPKPVGTIGAVASLLAGSRLVDAKSGLIPKGSEWLSDRELKRRGIWAGEQFRMGWWNDDADEFGPTYKGRHGMVDDGGSREFRIDARPKVLPVTVGNETE